MQTVYVKAHPSRSDSCHDFRNIHGKTDISSHSSHHISAFDKREGKDKRHNSGLRGAPDSKSDWKDSFGSKHKRHSSTDETNNRFRDRINGKDLASSRHMSTHRRSNSASMTSKPLASNTKDVNCPVFKENSSNSALKQRVKKKSKWIDSLSHHAQHQYARKQMRDLVKTPIHREPLISGSAKHMKKTQPSAVKHSGALYLYCYILWISI